MAVHHDDNGNQLKSKKHNLVGDWVQGSNEGLLEKQEYYFVAL